MGILAQNPYYQQSLVSRNDLPASTTTVDKNLTLYDFGKAYFGKLSLDASHMNMGDTLIVCLGERLWQGRIDRSPGGNIRVVIDTVIIDPDTKKLLWFPRKKNIRNSNGRAILLPDSMGIVLPFRAAEILSAKGFSKEGVERRVYYHRFNDQSSSFRSSDSLLNVIWDFCKHTIKATTFAGVYIDGDRERIPYEADALINQLSHYAVDSVYDIARNTAEYLMMNPAWPTEWHLQMHQIVWYDYLYTGNTELIRKYYKLLDLKTLRTMAGPDGLISTKTPGQDPALLEAIHYTTFDSKAVLRDITDWPQSGNKIAGPEYKGEVDGFVFCDYNSVVNAFHYQSLVLMAEFAKILNKQTDAAMYQKLAAQVKNAFQKRFIDPVTGLVKDGDCTSHSAIHANFFALAFGLVSPDEQGKVLSFLKSKGMACSVYGAQFLLDALYDHGEDAYATSLITDRGMRSWYQMLKSGATMTVEAWDIMYKPNLDWNHAWGTAALNAITRKIIGMEPMTAGSKTIKIEPRLSGLDSITASIPFPTGISNFKFTRVSSRLIIDLQLPKGSKAIFRHQPGQRITAVVINQKKAIANGKNDILLPAGAMVHIEMQ